MSKSIVHFTHGPVREAYELRALSLSLTGAVARLQELYANASPALQEWIEDMDLSYRIRGSTAAALARKADELDPPSKAVPLPITSKPGWDGRANVELANAEDGSIQGR